ncbi:DNA recombination protein RmuC [Microlunatus flavus]|uniref:DNA recombination protein RmuC n=2 Tax=Microlunatus flavus TaxID=1036181 RepID=A0A1H9KC65_9ACTN|nr:DNA recombination protein RmuC [Microlunatus flavus]
MAPGMLVGMDGFSVLLLLAALLVGLVAGVVGGMAVGRRLARAALDTTDAHTSAALAAARAEVADAQAGAAQARTEAATARAEAATARAELGQARADVAEAKAGVSDARSEAASAQAEAATVAAEMAGAVAQRDAAVARAAEISADREALLNHFKVVSAETLERQGRSADAAHETRMRATAELMAPVREQLGLLSTRLTEVEKERVAMSVDLRAQVQTVQQTGETLRRETTALVTALRKPQIRGSWGETQLKRVAEIAGMLDRCDFDLQRTMTTDDKTLRPDMRVNLAEGKHVFVDSKVPLSAFLEAAEAGDDAGRTDALARYGRHVRTHVDQLSAKQYWKGGETPEFVVLFLPSEAFFAAALEVVPDLYDYAAQRDVVLATPTTLIGLLRAVAYGWRQAALAESAAEVFRLGRELHERLGVMGSRLDKLGRALQSSVKAYNETVATVESRVMVQARRFNDLKVTEAELTGLTQLEATTRQIQAPELVEDATQVEPMVGRTSRRRGRSARVDEIPEAAELVRPEPDLWELVSDEVGPADEREARSS